MLTITPLNCNIQSNSLKNQIPFGWKNGQNGVVKKFVGYLFDKEEVASMGIDGKKYYSPVIVERLIDLAADVFDFVADNLANFSSKIKKVKKNY